MRFRPAIFIALVFDQSIMIRGCNFRQLKQLKYSRIFHTKWCARSYFGHIDVYNTNLGNIIPKIYHCIWEKMTYYPPQTICLQRNNQSNLKLLCKIHENVHVDLMRGGGGVEYFHDTIFLTEQPKHIFL